MKRRIVFALISVLICVGAAVWLVPYTPMPDMDGFWNVRIWRVNGADMTELIEQVNQTALREALTQVQANVFRVRSIASRWIRSATKSSRCIMIRRPSLISVNLILCTTATAGCMI